MPTIEAGDMQVQASTLELCKALIAKPSVTPEDAGCQKIIGTELERVGFQCRFINVGGVTNLWAVTEGSGPLLVFAGHTDVVPPGPLDLWDSPPFEPEIRDKMLFGRGAADMKGALAAMVTAVVRLLRRSDIKLQGRLGFLLTSDEEGPAIFGTKAVMKELQKENEKIQYCLIGEPSSQRQLADRIMIGRRGSINGTLKVTGKQGHIAYPQLADNPIPRALKLLDQMNQIHWDEGSEHFPPTSFQISNVQSGTGATNVIPADLEARFNLRFNPMQSAEGIQSKIEYLCENNKRENQGSLCSLSWQLSGQPFLTKSGELLKAVCDTIQDNCGTLPELSTGGGTSDGRFIVPAGIEAVELGLVSDSIHKTNESCNVEDLGRLSHLYEEIAMRLITGSYP